MIIDITNRYNSYTFVYGSDAGIAYSIKESYYLGDVEVDIICPQVPESYIVAKFDRQWIS